MHQILLSRHFREEIRQRMWGRGLSREGPIRSCSVIVTHLYLGGRVFLEGVDLRQIDWDFPGDAVVKNPPANAGDTSSSPGLGRSHMPQSN